MTRYAGKRYNKSPTGTAKGTDGQNPIQAPQKPIFCRWTGQAAGRTGQAHGHGRNRWTGERETIKTAYPPPPNRQAKPLMPHNLLAKFSAKSCPLPRNIWKNWELVSEIPRGRRNRTKNILERWYKCAKTGHKEGGWRANETLARGWLSVKRKQTPFEGLPLVWLVG